MAEFACVDETHYIHIGNNAKGQPCNSSICLASDQGFYEDDEHCGWWRCLGCGTWFKEMPKIEPEGLAALTHMKLRDQSDEEVL